MGCIPTRNQGRDIRWDWARLGRAFLKRAQEMEGGAALVSQITFIHRYKVHPLVQPAKTPTLLTNLLLQPGNPFTDRLRNEFSSTAEMAANMKRESEAGGGGEAPPAKHFK